MNKKITSIFSIIFIIILCVSLLSGCNGVSNKNSDLQSKTEESKTSQTTEGNSETTNTSSSNQSVVSLESVEITPETNTENTLVTYKVNNKLVKDNENITLDFNCSFIKFNTNNAYNGVILSNECKLDGATENISNIQLMILTKEFLEKSQMLSENEIVDFKCVISFIMDGEKITIDKELSQTEVSAISSFSEITEKSADYLQAIAKVRNNMF